MLNIDVPMAERGSRFSDAGYELPKPIIDVHGYPMISWVIENIRPETEPKFIFICQEEHFHKIFAETAVILDGEAKMKGSVYKHGNIITIPPMEGNDFEVLTEVKNNTINT